MISIAAAPALARGRHPPLPSQGLPVRGQVGASLLSVLQSHMSVRFLGWRLESVDVVNFNQCCRGTTFCQTELCPSRPFRNSGEFCCNTLRNSVLRRRREIGLVAAGLFSPTLPRRNYRKSWFLWGERHVLHDYNFVDKAKHLV